MKKRLLILGLAFLLSVFIADYSNANGVLSVDQYLKQVHDQNDGVKAASLKVEAGDKRSSEGNLVTSVKFFASAQAVTDRRPTVNPSFQGNRTDTHLYSLGLEQNSPLGLNWKLSENIASTEIMGANPAFLPRSQFYDVYPKFEANLPLLKNFLGTSTAAQRDAQNAVAEAQAQTARAGLETQLVQAEAIYWRLANLQQLVVIQKDILERAHRTESWSQERVKKDLADPSDMYQANSVVKLREIELENLNSELRSAQRTFNSLRGQSSDAVPEKLEFSEVDVELLTSKFTRTPTRSDIEAALAQIRAQEAQAKAAGEQVLPDLNLFGVAQLNGRDAAVGNAWTAGHKTNQPLYSVGVSFSIPLDVVTMARSRSAYRTEIQAAELDLSRKQLDLENDWQEIKRKLVELKTQLVLSKELEVAEKKKADYERLRLTRGRTTTQQSLLFEQDYASARFRRVQLETQARQLIAQLKLYKEVSRETR